MGILRQFDLFGDLTEEEFTHLHDIVHVHRFHRGDYLFMEGQMREAVYFVDRGLVKIFKVDVEGREHIVNILGARSLFPHAGLFDDSAYPGTAEVLVDSTLFLIPMRSFEDLLRRYPEMMQKMIRALGHVIVQLQEKVQQLSVFDAKGRVMALLAHFIEEYGHKQVDGIHVNIPVTHTEMAQMIALSRESVNRIWNELRREGVLTGNKDEWIFDAKWYEASKH